MNIKRRRRITHTWIIRFNERPRFHRYKRPLFRKQNTSRIYRLKCEMCDHFASHLELCHPSISQLHHNPRKLWIHNCVCLRTVNLIFKFIQKWGKCVKEILQLKRFFFWLPMENWANGFQRSVSLSLCLSLLLFEGFLSTFESLLELLK